LENRLGLLQGDFGPEDVARVIRETPEDMVPAEMMRNAVGGNTEAVQDLARIIDTGDNLKSAFTPTANLMYDRLNNAPTNLVRTIRSALPTGNKVTAQLRTMDVSETNALRLRDDAFNLVKSEMNNQARRFQTNADEWTDVNLNQLLRKHFGGATAQNQRLNEVIPQIKQAWQQQVVIPSRQLARENNFDAGGKINPSFIANFRHELSNISQNTAGNNNALLRLLSGKSQELNNDLKRFLPTDMQKALTDYGSAASRYENYLLGSQDILTAEPAAITNRVRRLAKAGDAEGLLAYQAGALNKVERAVLNGEDMPAVVRATVGTAEGRERFAKVFGADGEKLQKALDEYIKKLDNAGLIISAYEGSGDKAAQNLMNETRDLLDLVMIGSPGEIGNQSVTAKMASYRQILGRGEVQQFSMPEQFGLIVGSPQTGPFSKANAVPATPLPPSNAPPNMLGLPTSNTGGMSERYFSHDQTMKNLLEAGRRPIGLGQVRRGVVGGIGIGAGGMGMLNAGTAQEPPSPTSSMRSTARQ
jgi:hypothetical protein